MPKNKWVLIVGIFYIIDFLLLLLYSILSTTRLLSNRTQDSPFLWFPDGFVILLTFLEAVVIALLAYGIMKTKKWAYKLGIVIGVLAFVNLFMRLDVYGAIPTISAFILFLNKKNYL